MCVHVCEVLFKQVYKASALLACHVHIMCPVHSMLMMARER